MLRAPTGIYQRKYSSSICEASSASLRRRGHICQLPRAITCKPFSHTLKPPPPGRKVKCAA